MEVQGINVILLIVLAFIVGMSVLTTALVCVMKRLRSIELRMAETSRISYEILENAIDRTADRMIGCDVKVETCIACLTAIGVCVCGDRFADMVEKNTRAMWDRRRRKDFMKSMKSAGIAFRVLDESENEIVVDDSLLVQDLTSFLSKNGVQKWEPMDSHDLTIRLSSFVIAVRFNEDGTFEYHVKGVWRNDYDI